MEYNWNHLMIKDIILLICQQILNKAIISDEREEKEYMEVEGTYENNFQDERIRINKKQDAYEKEIKQCFQWSLIRRTCKTWKQSADEAFQFSNLGSWPLYFASKGNHVQSVQFLLQFDFVNPKARDSKALRWACKFNSFEVLSVLLKDKRADPNDRYMNSSCVTESNLKTKGIRILLNDGRIEKSEWNQTMMDAIRKNNIEVLRLFKNSNMLDVKAVHLDLVASAISYGNKSTLQFFIEEAGFSLPVDALSRCMRSRRADQVSCILSYKDPRLNFPNGLLEFVSDNNDTQSFQILLKEPKVVPTFADLLKALNNGRLSIFSMILEDGRVDPSSQNDACLYRATLDGRKEFVRLLCRDKRVNISASHRIADSRGFKEIANIMIEEKGKT